MSMPFAKRNYQDSLFRHLFGSEKRKSNALDLYNALANTDYDDPDELELTTIGDAVFLGRANDVSFLVGDEMVLLEHQSTQNPNMPLRGLQYFSRLFGKLIEQRDLDVYDDKQLTLPTPKYIVLYFGDEKRPDRETLHLSDSFAAGPGDLEVTARVINCNDDRNRAIIEACEALKGYSRLVTYARGFRADGMDQDVAVHAAVEQCIHEGVLADYLSAHRAEVEEMLFTIQDEERAMRVHMENLERRATETGMAKGLEKGMEKGLEEGMAKGLEQGMAKGMEQGMQQGLEQGLEQGLAKGLEQAHIANVRSLIANLNLTADQAMDALSIPLEDRPAIAEKL